MGFLATRSTQADTGRPIGTEGSRAPTLSVAIGVLLVGWLLAIAWKAGDGGYGIAALSFYVALCLPGFPVGFALFGSRHAAGWISGALIGYAASAAAFWVAIRAGVPTPAGFGAAWIAVGALALALAGRPPLVQLSPWRARDTASLTLTLLLVPLLVTVPFARVGERDEAGADRYRAYFTADLLWHGALASELGRMSPTPRDPYLAREPLRYYWTYFLPPSIVSRLSAAVAIDALLVAASLAAVLFIAAMYVFAWCIVPRAVPAAAAVTLVTVASSAEGWYEVWRLMQHGMSLSLVREVNIDAVALWRIGSLTLDGVPRGLWYTPHHSMACALGLVSLLPFTASTSVARPLTAGLAGCCLGLAAFTSPFPGSMFALVYGLCALWRACCGRRRLALLLRYSIAALPYGLALAWLNWTGATGGASASLAIVFDQLNTRTLTGAAVAVGPVLAPALAGAWLGARRFTISPAVLALASAAAAFVFVQLQAEPIWIGWRAGQVALVSMPPLIAAALAAASDRGARRVAVAAVTGILIAGMPTTAIDTFNAQDVSNTVRGPGFRWTLVLPADARAGLDWIRTHTRPTAVVQMSIGPRERDTWTLVPTFAGRRMAAGRPISLLHRAEYDEYSDLADGMFRTTDIADACQTAYTLHLQYVYLDRVEREAFGPAAMEKFETGSGCFVSEFAQGDVAVFRVK